MTCTPELPAWQLQDVSKSTKANDFGDEAARKDAGC